MIDDRLFEVNINPETLGTPSRPRMGIERSACISVKLRGDSRPTPKVRKALNSVQSDHAAGV